MGRGHFSTNVCYSSRHHKYLIVRDRALLDEGRRGDGEGTRRGQEQGRRRAGLSEDNEGQEGRGDGRGGGKQEGECASRAAPGDGGAMMMDRVYVRISSSV
jgi:hypothetical protein